MFIALSVGLHTRGLTMLGLSMIICTHIDQRAEYWLTGMSSITLITAIRCKRSKNAA
jgi:hypothetical protein